MTQPTFIIRPMSLLDVRHVSAIERQVFSMPWPSFIYVHEIDHNHLAYMGLIEQTTSEAQPPKTQRSNGLFDLGWLGRGFQQATPPLAAYGGVWLDGTSGHISVLATAPDYRRQGFGELMLIALIGRAITKDMTRMLLEVRVSNTVAQALYRKYGFEVYETRRAYYHDNDEDAYVMVTPQIDSDYHAMLRQRVAALRQQICFEDRYSEWIELA